MTDVTRRHPTWAGNQPAWMGPCGPTCTGPACELPQHPAHPFLTGSRHSFAAQLR